MLDTLITVLVTVVALWFYRKVRNTALLNKFELVEGDHSTLPQTGLNPNQLRAMWKHMENAKVEPIRLFFFTLDNGNFLVPDNKKGHSHLIIRLPLTERQREERAIAKLKKEMGMKL